MSIEENSPMEVELRFTIREWLRRVRSPRHLVVLGCVILVFSWLAPFGTSARLEGLAQPLYWTLAIGLNSPLGMLVLPVSVLLARAASGLQWVGMLIGGLVVALPGTGIVLLLEAWLASPLTMAWDLAYVYASVALVHVIIGFLAQEVFYRRPASASASASASSSEASPFLARLSPALGPNLIHLRMRDHYVEAHTELGSELVLMRFGDAVRELEDMAGARVHRSHWVASKAVLRLVRDDGKIFLELSNGTRVPVSRSYRQAALELEAQSGSS